MLLSDAPVQLARSYPQGSLLKSRPSARNMGRNPCPRAASTA